MKQNKSRLKHITFTGVDGKTDVRLLREIQKEYPIAEFGVLTSLHWYENGNRYLDPAAIGVLRSSIHEPNLHLSLHVCGSAAHSAAVGDWDTIDKLTWGNLDIFKRVQLNVSNRKDNPEYCWIPLVIGQELIVQQKDVDNVQLFDNTLKHWQSAPYPHRDTISMLLDASGGRGIDTPLKVFPFTGKTGYAGGFNPDNAADKLDFLMQNHTMGDFWIDMESGVRTDDWFDLNKVVKVLESCRLVINEWEARDYD